MRAGIAVAASVARLSAALLVFVATARYALTAVTDTVGREAPDLVPSAIKDRPILTADPPAPPPAPPPAGPTATRGASLRIPVVVSVGTDRSAVRINGAEVGHSPYVGEVSCKAGETIRIELIPKTGTSRQFLRECVPGALRLTED
jgi:hypothetical protein